MGVATVKASAAAALHCTAIYAGSVQHQFWIADPTTAQNAKRVAYETIDGNLTALRETFRRESYKGRGAARELESNISWLLWMLGFSVAHLGAVTRAQDAADILATTPQGHFAVVECTTGMLRADNKLPKLIERAEIIRRRLEASGNRHLRVITAIVTSKPRDEIRPELEAAERQRVLVIAREDLEEAVANTAAHQDADQLFERAENAIQEKFAKHDAKQQLPLPLIAGGHGDTRGSVAAPEPARLREAGEPRQELGLAARRLWHQQDRWMVLSNIKPAASVACVNPCSPIFVPAQPARRRGLTATRESGGRRSPRGVRRRR